MIPIKLNFAEIILGSMAGVLRQVENMKLNRKPAYGAGHSNDWQLSIEGCLGEYALAKYLKVYWPGKGNLGDFDVGDGENGYDVRTAGSDNKRLILHEKDPNDRVFWFLTGVNGSYNVRGWIKGIDGKKQEYWEDPSKEGGGKRRPAFFVPTSALNPPCKAATWITKDA